MHRRQQTHLTAVWRTLAQPMARNWLYAGQRTNAGGAPNVFWSPMSLNHPGKLISKAACGGEVTGDPRFTVGGKCGLSGSPRTQLSGFRFQRLCKCRLGAPGRLAGPQLLPVWLASWLSLTHAAET